MNNIEKIRAEIKAAFDPTQSTAYNKEIFVSPSGNFKLETANYWQKKPDYNWEVTTVEIYCLSDNKLIFEFIGNDGHFFHSWLYSADAEYLICAEDLYGGQTVIDLTNEKMASYSPDEDGFIWTDFHLSPDGKTLATIGCYWACPFVIKLFDFTNPLVLPLKELKEIKLIGNDEIIIGWVGNETFKTKGVKREYEMEYFENGSQRVNVISETEVERIININAI